MKTHKFNNYINNILQELAGDVTQANPNNSNDENAVQASPEVINKYKQNVLMPMSQGKSSSIDPTVLQQAIKDGVIEHHGDNIFTIRDTALPFINKDPQLQGKFIDSQSAAAQQKDARVQAQKTKLQSQQGPTQNKQQPIKPQGPMGASTTAFGATQYNPSKQ